MDKPAPSIFLLKIHYCPILHQIHIPPTQILSPKSTISSKVVSERVLLSNHHCPAFQQLIEQDLLNTTISRNHHDNCCSNKYWQFEKGCNSSLRV